MLLGTRPEQVPTNADLGSLAYLNTEQLLALDIKPVSSNTTAKSFNYYVITAAADLTLPPDPNNGDWVVFANRSGGSNVSILRSGNNIMGLAEDMRLNILNVFSRLAFVTGLGWVLI